MKWVKPNLGVALSAFFILPSAFAFEGRISATIIQGNDASGLLYTVGTNSLRVEMTATNWPNPVDILDLQSGTMTLLFPHNRSFVRLKPVPESPSAAPGFPQMPGGLPPGVGPQSPPPGAPAMPNLPAREGIGPTNLPGMPAPNMPALPPAVGPRTQPATMPGAPPAAGMPSMPAMPMMPPPMMEKMELKAIGEKTNLLGFACEKFEIKQRGETMEIWATDQLLPFQNYIRNQPHRFGPRMIEEQWAGMVKARKLFPLRATLKFDNGTERFRFEVKSVTPQKLRDEDAKLFEPPAGYFEVEPLPF
jgi:hypothetical protein